MAKRDEQRRINTRPEGSVQAAGTLVTSSQVVGGLPNTIGGWVFGPASLGNSGIVLHSGGWIQVGVDDYTVRLDAMDTQYRMWAGAPLGADAPFSITVDGSLHAENAYIEGEIEAASGLIGGFEIGADYIRDVANSMGLASTVTGGDDVRFWAGDTFANRATADFRVTESGLLTATGATIEGALTATTGELIDLDVSGTLTLVSAGIIESDNYAAGLAGWQIDYAGNAEFANIHARGRVDTAVFQYDQISAVAGSILVTPEAGVLAAAYTTAGTMTIEGAGFAFTDESVVRIRAKDSLGAVQQVWVTVTRTGTDNVYTTAKESGDDKTWPVGTAVLGYGTGGGSLMMTAASALDGPRYSINTHSTSPWTDESEIGRFGFLDDWQTYAGTDYGIAIGDYGTDGTDGNYLLYGTTTGFLMRAGGGALTIDEDGVRMSARIVGSYDAPNAVSWVDPNGVLVGSLWTQAFAVVGGDAFGLHIEVGPGTGADDPSSLLTLQAMSGYDGKNAGVQIIADGFDEYAMINVNANEVDDESYIQLQADEVRITGDIVVGRNATTYTGYIFVPLATPATSTAWDGDAFDSGDNATIDLSAVFGIPAGVKAVLIRYTFNCPEVGKIVRFGPSSATSTSAIEQYSQIASRYISQDGVVVCDANGDIYFSTTAVNGQEANVWLFIHGYWI